jgi:putative endonuclease
MSRLSSRTRPSAENRRELGRQGEDTAAQWYERAGYRIAARNWRCSEGEIDLVVVAPDGETVVICEVKTRSSTSFGSPEEAVTLTKQRRLRRLAARWLSQQPPGRTPSWSVRFDVVAVMSDRSGTLVADVFQDAF